MQEGVLGPGTPTLELKLMVRQTKNKARENVQEPSLGHVLYHLQPILTFFFKLLDLEHMPLVPR